MVAYCAYSLVMERLISGSVCDVGIESNKVLCVALAWNCGPMGRAHLLVNDPSARCERGAMALL